ncbi:hypothetical protein J6590_011367 [Homalodisca vitripennis]|nr:hypothetical protein J6590_011367 [Homalodisca vitripennis]
MCGKLSVPSIGKTTGKEKLEMVATRVGELGNYPHLRPDSGYSPVPPLIRLALGAVLQITEQFVLLNLYLPRVVFFIECHRRSDWR